ncbi:YciI family protein [Pseudoalteromonas espejiana]
MLYMIYSTDVENSLSLRKEARPAHLARLSELDSQNRLFVAGPLPAIDSEDPQDAGFTGSLVIAEFESLEKAREWAAADPYVAAGVYANSVVKPYKKYYQRNEHPELKR